MQRMQAAYDATLSMVVDSAQPIVSAQPHASSLAAPIMASVQAGKGVVSGPVQAREEEAAPSLAQLQPGSRPAASAPAQLPARQAPAGLPETLAHKAPAPPPSAAMCAAGTMAAKPHAESPRRSNGAFSHVSVVYDSGAANCRSSSSSFGSSGQSLQNVKRGSVRPSRLGEERQPAQSKPGNAVASGQKRQALSELRPQTVKHSQREQQAWTQCTDDSDDFA